MEEKLDRIIEMLKEMHLSIRKLNTKYIDIQSDEFKKMIESFEVDIRNKIIAEAETSNAKRT